MLETKAHAFINRGGGETRPSFWCDTSASPTAGCDGCRLWPDQKRVGESLSLELNFLLHSNAPFVENAISEILGPYQLGTDIFHGRHAIVDALIHRLRPVEHEVFGCTGNLDPGTLVSVIDRSFHCEAGRTHLARAERPDKAGRIGRTALADKFERPKLNPGAMAQAANLPDLRGVSRPGRPWLDGLPRVIEISPLGEALSASIPFEFLRTEIIDVVNSPAGSRHEWVWPTRCPERMVRFSQWLSNHGCKWPKNLIPAASASGCFDIERVYALLEIPCERRCVILEPLVGPVHFGLSDFEWLITGGQRGREVTSSFELLWVYDLLHQARLFGVAFFLTQLGGNATHCWNPLNPQDPQGSDWREWPADLRIREMPF
jgi:protein gp37